MNNKLSFILFVLLFFHINTTHAGWYECFNYKGSIAQYPITLSLQLREGYFGEDKKKDFNVIAVYKYDKFNTPIRLEGKLDQASKTITLYEGTNDKTTATFKFQFSEQECTGTWTSNNTQKSLPLKMNLVSRLVDILPQNHFTDVEVLQFESLKEFYFNGIYSKEKGEQRAYMTELHIIQKKDNTLFQVIDFSDIDSNTGNLMTLIFSNISILSTNGISVSLDIGRIGGYLQIDFDKKTGDFVLNPKPFIDGQQN